MEAFTLNAVSRRETGKGTARRLRMAGYVPAVFYAPHAAAMPLSVKASDLLKLLKKQEENVFVRLIIDSDGRKSEKSSIIKEIQSDPMSQRLNHVDFYEISMDVTAVFDLPVHFTGISKGVENGGELQHVKRELKVSCLPAKLPEFIEADISGLDIGDHLRVCDLRVADGITLLEPQDAVVAVVSATRASLRKTEASVPEEAAEPEVLSRKGGKSEN